MIELKTYAGSNVTPQNDAIMNDANTMNNGIYYGCNVTIKDATTLHINAGQGIVYGRLFEVLDSDIPVSLSPSGTLLGQLYVHIDLSNIAAPIQILVDTGETLANLEDDPQLNIDSGITDMQLATFTVSTVGISDLVETFKAVEPIRAVLGDADISAIGDGTVKGSIRTINTHLSAWTTTEIVVGTWNGKTLYRRSFTGSKTGTRAVVLTGVDAVVSVKGFLKNLNARALYVPYSETGASLAVGIVVADGDVLLLASDNNWGNGTYELTLEYTKA